MNIILATEIWGRTCHVDALAQVLGRVSGSVVVVDPYEGVDPGFPGEEEAYARYLEACGHAAFAARVSDALRSLGGDTALVGFSAGAGAVWATLCGEDTPPARMGICFYGSMIRTMLEGRPSAPVDLVFPSHEGHFDVCSVVDALRGRPAVRCHVVPQGHGFMNPLSAQYDEAACRAWLAWIGQRLVASGEGHEARWR